MDSRLNIQINISDNIFTAIDLSPYDRWSGDGDIDITNSYVILQRLVLTKQDDNILKSFNTSIANSISDLQASWEVPNITNGLYYYQKIIIPTVSFISNDNHILWYDLSRSTVCFWDIDSRQSFEYNPQNDFDAIWNIIQTKIPAECFFFDEYSFTIENLVKCYINAETQRLQYNMRNGCMGNCGGYDANDWTDLLLAAILVITDLINKDEFFEAQRILESLQSCNGLCNEDSGNTLINCGCGRT